MIETLVELDRVRDECRSLVTKRAIVSAAASAVPLPGVDAAADVALLINLLPQINKRFKLTQADIESLDPDSRRLALKIVTGIGNALIGAAVTEQAIVALLKRAGLQIATASVAKYVPVIGTAVAGGLSFAAMRWIGTMHIEDCYAAAKALLKVSAEGKASA